MGEAPTEPTDAWTFCLLVLTHISTRYTSDLNIKNEAKEIFKNTIVANDFTEINIGKDKTSINFKNILTVNND